MVWVFNAVDRCLMCLVVMLHMRYCTVYCENAVQFYGFGLAAARALIEQIDARKF
jgi:hypothetical protein